MHRSALALLAAACLAACGGGDGATGPDTTSTTTTPPPVVVPPVVAPSIAGTYVLQTMQGVPVPAVYFLGDDYHFDVTAGAFELRADRTYRIVLTMRHVDATGWVTESPEQEIERGRYEANGALLTLRSEAGVTMSATLEGDVITMRLDGQAFAYRKR